MRCVGVPRQDARALSIVKPKNGSWNAEQPFVLSTVEAFVPGNVEA